MTRKDYRRVLAVACFGLAAACQDTTPPTSPSEAPDARAGRQDPLPAWFARSSPEVLALPGTVFADHDEVAKRLVFGVENASVAPGVRAVLARLGIPSSAYAVEVTKPIHQMDLRTTVLRPTQGGIQIHFGQYLCTLGFNVSQGESRSFITNSHCTNTQGGTEGTTYYQPTSTLAPDVIATEAADPTYFTFKTNPVCPRGKKCRYSDASRALYSDGTGSSRGEIVRTKGENNGDLTIEDVFTVAAQDNSTTNFATGLVVNKVGRTTGWTQGKVARTCVNTSVSGSNIMQLCQTFVSDPGGATVVSGGDSGSPVFEITDLATGTVRLVGILWGGSSDNKTFVFSPLKQIQQELATPENLLVATK